MRSIHLRSGSISLVIGGGTKDNPEAEILHWGKALPALESDVLLLSPPIPHSAFDTPVIAGLIPQASSGWAGRPGLRGSRNGDAFSPRLRLHELKANAAGDSATVIHRDDDAGLSITHHFNLHPGGMLELSAEVMNTGTTPYHLDELALVLPVPTRASELLDLSGRWCREQHPQRQPILNGTWVRSGRHGRTGHDSPLLFAAGTAGFGNRHGEVWATHLAWSGNREQYLEAVVDGRRVIGATELLMPGEIILQPGESYRTPTLYAASSDRGMDGVTSVFYDWFRQRRSHPRTPRPVVLNTWEAVYFEHSLSPLLELADRAASLGIERFVLDDGWFRGRIDDRRALGDWTVDETRWPEGLHPLVDFVTSRGMDFGLWVEPEMISRDSQLAREHPDWISRATLSSESGRLPREWRHQQVLDLLNPDAWQYVYDRIHDLLGEYDIAYLKWDHNRDHLEAGHDGKPSTHEQTLAVYRLIDALKAAHPEVEIESCASGGGRVDLGILSHTDRIWPSDCNDALERQSIQRWTQAVIPPELVGSHIGPPVAHTTGRALDLSFRAITALFGHLGIEWDIRTANSVEMRTLAAAISLYKRHRALIHSGTRVNLDTADPNLVAHGVVAVDGSEALYAVAALGTLVSEMPGRLTLPGLDAQRRYQVQLLTFDTEDGAGSEVSEEAYQQIARPLWMSQKPQASGTFLAEVGIAMPILRPAHGLLLHLSAV